MMLCKKRLKILSLFKVCKLSNYRFVEKLKKIGTKHLIIFDDSCEEIFNSKASDIATAGRRRGLNTINIQHNLFHQSKLGRDFELQKTHIVLFKSARDVMQVSALIVQLGLGLEQVDWYRDATSVPYGHLLIDLSARTDGQLRYCTNTRTILSKFHIPDRLKQSKIWKMNTQKLSTLRVFQSISNKYKSLFLQSRPKQFISFLRECVVNLLKGNLQSIKRHHVTKLQKEL